MKTGKIAVVNTFGEAASRWGRGRIVGFASTVEEALRMSRDPAFRESLPGFERAGVYMVSMVPGDARVGDVCKIRRPAVATVREHGRTLAVYQHPYTFALVEWSDGTGQEIGYKKDSEYLLAFASIDDALECARGLFRGEPRGVLSLHKMEAATMVAP